MERFEMARQGLVVNNTTGPFCFYADAQATIAALQARVKDLKEWLAAYKQSIELAQSSLTQRTAELEAIETILDIDSGKTTVDKVRDLHRAFKQVWESYQDASNEMFKAQAELERVRGELVEATHNANVYQSLYSTGCMDRALLENELRDLRTLILTLPKVEGEIVAQAGYVKDRKKVYACFGSVVDMTAYAALLQHRQGMEG